MNTANLSRIMLIAMASLLPMHACANFDGSPSQQQTGLNNPSQAQHGQASRPLNDWDYSALYEQSGFRADALLKAAAFSPQEDKIGEIVNIVLDQQNQIVTVIAEVGGMWDSGDRHVAIPWDEVELFEAGIKVPVRQENVEEYDLFTNVTIDEAYIYKQEMERVSTVEEDVATGPQTWKISDIIDDYASIESEEGYGYITDALFTRNGIMQAIIVKPSSEEFGSGPRAYPFYGYPEGWRPGNSHYQLPYASDEVKELPVFDYDRHKSVVE